MPPTNEQAKQIGTNVVKTLNKIRRESAREGVGNTIKKTATSILNKLPLTPEQVLKQLEKAGFRGGKRKTRKSKKSRKSKKTRKH